MATSDSDRIIDGEITAAITEANLLLNQLMKRDLQAAEQHSALTDFQDHLFELQMHQIRLANFPADRLRLSELEKTSKRLDEFMATATIQLAELTKELHKKRMSER